MPEIVRKNPVNDPTQKPVKTHSKFNPNYSLYQTPLFGLNTPFFAMAGVADDDISLRLSADVDTYTLKAPSMAPLKRSVDYFMLPLRCLLPNASELLITNPLRGDDVVAKNVNAVLDRFKFDTLITQFIGGFNTYLCNPATPPSDATSTKEFLARLFNWLQVGAKLFSCQSLCKNLGYSFDSYVFFQSTDGNGLVTYYTFDQVFGIALTWLEDRLNSPNSGNGDNTFTVEFLKPTATNTNDNPSVTTSSVYRTYALQTSNVYKELGYYSLNEFVYDLMTYDLPIVGVTSINTNAFFDTVGGVTTFQEPFNDVTRTIVASAIAFPKDMNLLRVLAYQKASAEFYTVDTVDDIYSARLWEQNQNQWAYLLNGSQLSFVVNGVNVAYDSCAGINIGNCLDLIGFLMNSSDGPAIDFTSGDNVAAWCYFINLFNYTRSLRYQDYFVGSRVRPLAVGDVNVDVQSGSPNYVDVVDVSKKIQVQRFLNQVNRIGRKFSDYVKGILGDKPMTDAHEPIFLGHVVDTIGASEVTNTGAAQQSQAQSKTSNYRSNSNRYAFTVHVPEPAVIIGIQNYDIPRVYGSVNDRENYHIDRYDAFNPYMQFVGDQPVFQDEIIPGGSDNFGYQMRYSEYKQRVSCAAGGFLGSLPGYAKIFPRKYFLANPSLNTAGFVINSDFIRARVSDIDEFYLRLYVTNPLLAFHFIIRNDMEVTAHRPMAFAPSIL